MARVTSTPVVICEGISGTWLFHIAAPNSAARSLCGERVMPSSVPVWGCQPGNDQIAYRWCQTCADKAGMGPARAFADGDAA